MRAGVKHGRKNTLWSFQLSLHRHRGMQRADHVKTVPETVINLFLVLHHEQ